MNSSLHIGNKKIDILIIIKDPTQRLEHTLTVEKLFSVKFIQNNEKICLSLHCNGANSDLFVNGTGIIKLKAKDSEIIATPLCLGNISKDFSVDNVKKTRLMDMFVILVLVRCYSSYDILDIHKYLVKKHNIE